MRPYLKKPKSRKTPEARDDQFLLGNLSWRDQLHQSFMTGVLFLPPVPATTTRLSPGPQALVPRTFTVPVCASKVSSAHLLNEEMFTSQIRHPVKYPGLVSQQHGADSSLLLTDHYKVWGFGS